jgi:hypothetical protein
MITVTSSTEVIIETLKTEEPKAIYWMKKMLHGERGYEKMQQELIDRAMDQRKDTRSDVYDYISKDGNRWMVFEHCRYHKDIHYAHTMPVAFCYYETYGSVGAFVSGHTQYKEFEKMTHDILFTDHFFLRFCQRLGVEMRSRWMVQRFLEIIPGIMFQARDEKDQYGRTKVDCRFPGSIGRGIIRKDGPLIEIRTYLTDPELNRKQLKETKSLRKIADRHNFDPADVKMVRMLKSGDFGEAFEYEMNQVIDMGADKDSVYATATVGVYVTRALVDLDYIEATDIETWKRAGEVNATLFIDIADYWLRRRNVDREFVAKFEQIFKNIGIKDYNIVEFINYIFKMMTDDAKKFKQTENN